jgi:hypothetical protein
MLKLGVLHAQHGVWQGRRILSERWIEAATRAHSQEGYGYHWMAGPQRTFCAMGVFGQLLVVFPDHEATLALTGAVNGVNACTGTLLPRVHRHFPGVFCGNTGEPRAAEESLQARARRVATAPLPAAPAAARHGHLEYRMEPNPLGVSGLQLNLTADACTLRLVDGEDGQIVTMGLGRWLEGEASAPAPDLHHGYEMRRARVVASARWTDPDTLEMTWIFVESAFRDTVTCRFEGEQIRYSRRVNVNSAALSQPVLTGRRVRP